MTSTSRGGFSGDSLIETVDGPVAIGKLVGKSMPVLTRLPDGAIGFRLMTDVASTGEGVAVLRVTFDNDQAVRVVATHTFFRQGMEACEAAALRPGDLLESSFHFPAGYEMQRLDGSRGPSAGAVRVVTVADGGTADVFTGSVKETGAYFTTAGVLCGS